MRSRRALRCSPVAAPFYLRWSAAANGNTANIIVQSLDTGARHVVLERGADARYVSTSHLVYALGGTLLAVPFDVAKLAVTGAAVPLVEDVAQSNVTAALRDLAPGSTGVCAERRYRRIPFATDPGVGRSPRPRGADQDALLARISIHDCHPTELASRSMSEIRKGDIWIWIWR